MALGTFLAGVVAGALLATLLTHADSALIVEVPTTFSDALAQIAAGWARPASLALSLLRHPLLLSSTLGALLGARSAWRSCVLRPLWLNAPAALKTVLEMHSALLGVAVVAAAPSTSWGEAASSADLGGSKMKYSK